MRAHEFLLRQCRRGPRLREKIELRGEAFTLLLTGGVGIICGLVNLTWYHASESVKVWLLGHAGDPVETAEMLETWARVLEPALGGLLAGLILHWGLRFVGPQGPSNILEVVV